MGSKGTGDGKFLRPHDLEFDNHNKYLYAVDRDGNRIQVFDKNGTFLFKFGQKGHGDGQFLVPYGLDVDQAGNVYVTDPQSDLGCTIQPRVLKFDSNGNFITKFGSYGIGPCQFKDPEHLSVDSERNVYVSDRKNDNIQVFAPINKTMG
jgi:DNA-binding beta-propeller fold protein YncE